MTSSFTNLCFAGGGVKGFAYIGAIQKLDEHKLLNSFTRYIGTSIGSIFVSLLCLGYTSQEISTLQTSLQVNDLEYSGCIISEAYDVISNYGMVDPNILRKKIETLVQLKADVNITLSQLFQKTNKELVIVTCCLNQLKPVYLHHAMYPNVKLVDAMMASAHIPIYFQGSKYSFDATHPEEFYVDGSLVNNYAICVFNDLPKLYAGKVDEIDRSYVSSATLGIKLLDKDETNSIGILKTNVSINSCYEYISCLINTLMIETERSEVSATYIAQTIGIPTGSISFLDFKITVAQKQDLINRAKKAVEEYFSVKK